VARWPVDSNVGPGTGLVEALGSSPEGRLYDFLNIAWRGRSTSGGGSSAIFPEPRPRKA
jgi:hypothetical protein